MQYTYQFEPEMYKYILSTNILNKKKDEDKIFKQLVMGYTAKEISKKFNYAESTIWNRRRDIYNKTKKYMI
jgi:DNA-binding NarL/FixJ family response regulator